MTIQGYIAAPNNESVYCGYYLGFAIATTVTIRSPNTLLRMQTGPVFLGKRIRQLREAKKITQETLAHEAGLSRNGMGLIEQGKNDGRDSPHLLRIADALDTTVENVMRGISGSRTRAKKRRYIVAD